MPLESLEEESILDSTTLRIFNKKKKITYSVSGNILNGLGAVVSGATVTISRSGYSDSTTTDGSGNFSFSGITEGTYTVTPTKTGSTFVPANQSVTIPTTGSIDFISPVTYSITLTGTGANYHNSETVWYNTGNIVVNDSSYANACIADQWTSDTLKFIAGVSQVPVDSTIKGLTVTVIRRYTDAGQPCTDTVAQLMNSNTFIGDNKKNGTAWATADWQTITYGGTTDLWGYAITPTLVNSGNFAFGLRVDKAGGALCDDAYVQYISMSISITVPAEA